jgi:hypothetical protein
MTNTTTPSAFDLSILEGYSTPMPPKPTAPTATPRDKWTASLTPLHERLGAKLATFPADVMAQGLRLSQIWPLVSGRQREKPRAFEVADALRQLGWQRYRVYSDKTAPSGTFWFPPTVTAQNARAAMKAR